MQSARTCVICVNFRRSDDTAACLRSLLASRSAVKTVVVDTTPHDPELEKAIAFACDVELIRADENLGFGVANNLGIAWALGNTNCEFVFLLNNDATVFPDSIGLLTAALEQHPGVGIAAPRIAYMHDPGRLWYGGGEIDWCRASAVTPGFNGSVNAELAMTERDVTFASGCAFFARAAVLRRLGGFDPRFFMYEEDFELCLRAREMHIRIRYVPQSLILHRGQGSDPGAAASKQDLWSVKNARLPFFAFHIIRNRLLNIFLHARGRSRCIAILFFPLFISYRAVLCLLGGRMDGVKAMFRGIGDFWRARRSPQAVNCERQI